MHEMRLTVQQEWEGEFNDRVRVTIRDLQKDGSLKHACWVAYRDVKATQWVYSYGGWSLERSVLQLLAKFEVMHIHFCNQDTGELLTSNLRDWRDHGLSVTMGGREHIVLPDKFWTIDEKDYTTTRFIKNKHKVELLLKTLAQRDEARKEAV